MMVPRRRIPYQNTITATESTPVESGLKNCVPKVTSSRELQPPVARVADSDYFGGAPEQGAFPPFDLAPLARGLFFGRA